MLFPTQICVLFLVVLVNAAEQSVSDKNTGCVYGHPGIPGDPGHNGMPGRDGRDGAKGDQGDRGKNESKQFDSMLISSIWAKLWCQIGTQIKQGCKKSIWKDVCSTIWYLDVNVQAWFARLKGF